MGALIVAVGCITLLFMGCLHLAGTGRVRSRPALPSEIAVDRLMRVRLGGRRPLDNVSLEVNSSFSVSDGATGAVIRDGVERLRRGTVGLAGGGGIMLGGRRYDSGDILIVPERDASVVFKGQTYRGCLRIRRVEGGLVFYNHVDVESYLRGVLRGELFSYFHPESFKAQAVAARTYALYQKRIAAVGRRFDVFDDESSQVYVGVQGEDRVAVRAVEATRGEVCVWNDGSGDRLFCTYYSSACGGRTQHVNNVKPKDPRVPPLAGGVECKDCYLARFYRWGPVRLSKEEVTKRLVARYAALSRLGRIVKLEPMERTVDGRIIRIAVVGARGGREILVGEDFRLSVGGRTLKSTCFEIETQADCFIFKDGKGYGHGVGLCQNGMETKARRGIGYREILTTYYPGAGIAKIY